MALTDTTALAGVVKTVFDKYIEFNLRSEPLYRDLADKRPVELAMAGDVVTFSFYADLAQVTGTLTEGTDPAAVAASNTSTVTVTLAERGNVVTTTEKLRLLSFSDIDPAVANMVAFNMRDSLDYQVQQILIAGTNVVTSNVGVRDATAQAVNTLTAADIFSSSISRYIVAKLRGASVVPRKEGLYACALHPDVSHDLRAETGAGGWRLPHEYQAGSQIWAGEIGTYEGAYFIETPRAFQATDGASSAKISRTLFFGQQALAEATAREPGVVIGPVVDSLARYRPIGWKGLLGWARYREAALWRVASGSSISQ